MSHSVPDTAKRILQSVILAFLMLVMTTATVRAQDPKVDVAVATRGNLNKQCRAASLGQGMADGRPLWQGWWLPERGSG